MIVDPDVIPLQVSGNVDNDLTKVSASELMAWGLSNLSKEGKEGGYAVQHGHKPVSDFSKPRAGEDADPNQPNYFECAYLCSYPYGVGSPEADRPTSVDF